jgi:peptidoglycan-associated lipoprotein
MQRLIFCAVFILALAACSSTPTKESGGAGVEERTPGSGAATSGAAGSGVGGNPLQDPANILSKRSVYFDFDSFIVKDEFKPLVTAHSKYLSQNKAAQVTITGNADERGSTEYNLALGQKRADAVKKVMTLLGATEAQIETVSFGKEKPKNPGHDEAAWAENRRADIVYQGEK